MTTPEVYLRPVYFGRRTLQNDSAKRGYDVDLSRVEPFTVQNLTIVVERRDGKSFDEASRKRLEAIANSYNANGLYVQAESSRVTKIIDGEPSDHLDAVTSVRVVDLIVSPYFLVKREKA